MQLFIVLLIVVGTLVGAGVVIALVLRSKGEKKSIQSVMEALNITFAPIGSASFWIKRDWHDTLFLSRIKEVTGDLSAFEGKTAEEKLEAELEKNRKKQRELEKGGVTVNGIDWNYAIATYKVEGNTLVRALLAVTGSGTSGLYFHVSLGTPDTIPGTSVEDLLSGLTSSR